jgi:PKHD-type hydroxylase
MLVLADVLNAEDIAKLRDDLSKIEFQDGKATAGAVARKVKSNMQATGAPVEPLVKFVREKLDKHAMFMAYARPARWSRLMFSRYVPGDKYGLHTDNATIGAANGGRLRTDLSFTLFLSDPDTYEGGALQIQGLDGPREFKPSAGGLVVYPTGQLHQVTPVIKGERLACVGWMQSLVRRADQREILFDLTRVRGALKEGPVRLLHDKSIGNLVRLWSEL